MPLQDFPTRGLYAVTDTVLCHRLGVDECVRQAIDGGAVVIQYRDKSTDQVKRQHEAASLLTICRRSRVPLIVNDDLELAAKIGADGVHLGRDDHSLARARAVLGPNSFVGVSCYNSIDLALAAQANGATYVAFGSFFPSVTKPGATPVSPSIIRHGRAELQLPVVGIGGITTTNGGALLDAGVDLLAVVSGIFALPSPREAARQFSSIF